MIEELFDDFTEFDEKRDEFDEENAPHRSLHLTESDDLICWAGGNKFHDISGGPAMALSEQHRKGCPRA